MPGASGFFICRSPEDIIDAKDGIVYYQRIRTRKSSSIERTPLNEMRGYFFIEEPTMVFVGYGEAGVAEAKKRYIAFNHGKDNSGDGSPYK